MDGTQSESNKILDAVIGVLLLCIVIACVTVLIGFTQREESRFVESMQETTDSAKMARINELSMSSEPVLCTAVANVLTEFGAEELAYVVVSADGVADAYHYASINVVNSNCVEHSSQTPIEEAVKQLLHYSDRTCTVNSGSTDEGFPYLVVLVNAPRN